MYTSPLPNREYLLKILRYSPSTGKLIWRIRADRPGWWNTRYAGKEAGVSCPDKNGLVVVRIDGVLYQAHRVIWMMVKNEDPGILIDHKNGDASNNRMTNLRKGNKSINSSNQSIFSKTSNTGYKNIHRTIRGKYAIRVIRDGRVINVSVEASLQNAIRVLTKFKEIRKEEIW